MTDETIAAPPPVCLLGIGGSTRAGALSRRVLEVVLCLAEEAGARIVLADVRALDLPLYDADRPLEAYPPTLAWLLNEVRSADAYLLCSSTYHGTVAGGVKNVLDRLNAVGADTPPYLGGKVVGLMALGRGGGGANVINSLSHAAHTLHGLAAPTVVTVSEGALDRDTGGIHDAVRGRLDCLVVDVVELTRRLRRADPEVGD